MIVFVPKQKPAEAESLLSAQASSVLVWMYPNVGRYLLSRSAGYYEWAARSAPSCIICISERRAFLDPSGNTVLHPAADAIGLVQKIVPVTQRRLRILAVQSVRRLRLQDDQGQSVYRHRGIDQRSARDQPPPGPVGALSGPVDDVCPLVGRQTLDHGSWRKHRGWVSVDLQEYPPSQVGGSLSIEKALQMVQNGACGGGK
jgi:hypothetical protein